MIRKSWMAVLAIALCAGCVESRDPAGSERDSGPAHATADRVPEQADEVFTQYVARAAAGWRYCARPSSGGPTLRTVDVGSGLQLTPSALEDTTYSTTNLQEASVDEADRVEYDGEFLYVAPAAGRLSGGVRFAASPLLVAPRPLDGLVPDVEVELPEPPEVRVLAASSSPPAAQQVASIRLSQGMAAVEGMYRLPRADSGDADRLVVLGPGRTSLASGQLGFGRTVLEIIDVSDPSHPSGETTLELEGSLVASRRLGDRLFLVTSHLPTPRDPVPCPADGRPLAAEQTQWQPTDEELLPRLVVDGGEPRPLVDLADCFVPESLLGGESPVPHVTTVTAIDLRDPDRPVSVCAAGFAGQVYASSEALYLSHSEWSASPGRRGWDADSRPGVRIHKFAFAEDGPRYRGEGRVEGSLVWRTGPFALGENRGVLGVMTAIGGVHRLTLLRESEGEVRVLEEVARLPNEREPAPIGKPGELLYSLRFMGDRVYAVTFSKVDPLYIIDVSDPERPYIAGEVEVPGFSDYLHPIGNNLLLGIGKDAREHGGITWYQGIKLELFDVSDPRTLASIDSVLVGMRGSESAALSDHHAVSHLALSAGLHRLAIPIEVHEGEPGSASTFQPWSHTGLHFFEVQEAQVPARSRLTSVGAVVPFQAAGDPVAGYDDRSSVGDRSVIHGDAVHYVHGDEVWSASWIDPESFVGPQ